jgi:hypothetical protein
MAAGLTGENTRAQALSPPRCRPTRRPATAPDVRVRPVRDVMSSRSRRPSIFLAALLARGCASRALNRAELMAHITVMMTRSGAGATGSLTVPRNPATMQLLARSAYLEIPPPTYVLLTETTPSRSGTRRSTRCGS